MNLAFTRSFLLALVILVGGCASYDYPLETFSKAPVTSPTPITSPMPITSPTPVNSQNFISLRLEPLSTTVPLGFSQQFSAVGVKGDGSSQDLSAEVSWATENLTIASVDDSGLVTGKGVGNTRVAATLGDLSASSEVIVSAAKLVELKINPENGSFLTSGAFYQLTAAGTFSDGSTQDLTEQVSWTIGSTPEVATISDQPGSKGQVRSKGLGSTQIKVQLDSVEAETSLTFIPGGLSYSPEAVVDVGTTTRPYSVSLGDLNADGILDIVTANWDPDNVSVLLGKGDGTFQAKQDFSVGVTSSSVTLGDLNADGILDIVTANGVADTVSALLGKRDGTFQAQQDFGVDWTPRSVTLGDLNADGILDIVTANFSTNNVSVLLGVSNH